jgi:phage shock protein PspC (stress-responsive transcriptional regulator)
LLHQSFAERQRMKKLHRSSEERKIAGVCAGLGDYFELDPVFFRLFFLFSILFGGLGAIAYVMLWILVPLREGAPAAVRATPLRLSSTDSMIAGGSSGLGAFFELDTVMFRAAVLVNDVIGGQGNLLYLVRWLLNPGPASREPPPSRH